MSEIKLYTGKYSTWNSDFEVVIEIDHDVCTEANLRELNNFWGGAEDRVNDEDGDVTKAVLKLLCAEILRRSVSAFDAVQSFNWNAGKGVEGWPSMDGSFGIKIISYDELEISTSDIEIEPRCRGVEGDKS